MQTEPLEIGSSDLSDRPVSEEVGVEESWLMLWTLFLFDFSLSSRGFCGLSILNATTPVQFWIFIFFAAPYLCLFIPSALCYLCSVLFMSLLNIVKCRKYFGQELSCVACLRFIVIGLFEESVWRRKPNSDSMCYLHALHMSHTACLCNKLISTEGNTDASASETLMSFIAVHLT